MSTFYKLDHFGFLAVAGVDAVSFMQGYTTCNLEELQPNQVRMGAICNLQGRMLASFLVIRQGHDLLFRMTRAQVQPTVAFLSKYIVFSKASLEDQSDRLVCYGLIDTPDPASTNTADIRDGMIVINLDNRSELWSETAPDGDIADDALPWIDREIEAGVAWVDDASSEQYLPQMFAYHSLGAIDFNKGCYLGQEIVARAQYRGELKRRLHRLPAPLARQGFEGGAVVACGTEASLAVITNSAPEPITVDIEGRSLLATPVV